MPCEDHALSKEPRGAFRFLWHLFVAAKSALLPQQTSPAFAPALLIACVNTLLANVPAGSLCLKRPFADTAAFPVRSTDGAADTVRCLLAASPHFNDPTVALALGKFTQALDAFFAELVAPFGLEPEGLTDAEVLPEVLLSAAAVIPPTLRDCSSPGSRTYPGLIDAEGRVHPGAIAALDAYFQSLPGTALGGIDTKLIVQHHPLLQNGNAFVEMPNLPSHSDGNETTTETKTAGEQPHALEGAVNQADANGSTQHAPSGGDEAMGPPRSARIPELDTKEALRWLHAITAGYACEAVPSILSLGVSPITAAKLAATAGTLVAATWPDQAHVTENRSPGELRSAISPRDLALALFNHALYALLSVEVQAQAARNVPNPIAIPTTAAELAEKLASRDVFSLGVLTLAVECVAATCQIPSSLDFPAVLQQLRLSALDLCRLIAPFALAVPELARGLKRHLMHVEERIVESLAWEESKVLKDTLRAATAMSHGGTSSPSLPQSLGASPPPGADPAAHALLSALLRKALKLATLRCSALLTRVLNINTGTSVLNNERLAAPDTLLLQMLTAIHVGLQDHTWLLYNRHLDHIVLCTFYGIAKANRLETVTFKALIEAYGTLPHSKSQTMRHITMTNPFTRPPAAISTESNKINDIIVFYNQVYLPDMERVLHNIVSGNVSLIQLPNLPLERVAGHGQGQGGATPHTIASPAPSPLHHRCPVHTPPRPLDGRLSASPLSRLGRPFPAAVKLSPGHWRMSPAGTSRLGNYPPLPAVPPSDDGKVNGVPGQVAAGAGRNSILRGKRKASTAVHDSEAQVRRNREWTPGTFLNQDTSRYQYSSPVDALLAAAADAEAEFRRSDGSTETEAS